MFLVKKSISLLPATLCVILLKSSLVAGAAASKNPKHFSVMIHENSEFYTENGQLFRDSKHIKTSLELLGSNQMRVLDQTSIHHYSVRMAGTNEWKDLGTVSDSKTVSEMSATGYYSDSAVSGHKEIPLNIGEKLVLDASKGSDGNVKLEAKIESPTLYEWILTSFSRLDKKIQYTLMLLIFLLGILFILIGLLLNEVFGGSKSPNFAHFKDLLPHYLKKNNGYQSLKTAKFEL